MGFWDRWTKKKIKKICKKTKKQDEYIKRLEKNIKKKKK